MCVPMRVLASVLLVIATGWSQAAPPAGPRHVPSPDWRDQIIYFVVTDRFADGDPRNNDQRAGEYDPSRKDRYSGGDLAGLAARLPYIRGLGATALWITPPVANQWTDPIGGYTGYHGYWAEHFKKVDKHVGTLADYRHLAETLHGQGMYLVQDIVLNHTGDFFDYRGGWDAADPTRFYTRNLQAKPAAAPSQPPFNLNDPRIPAHRRAAIYHWTPPVKDYTDPVQELTFQMAGLDDLNSANPRVRRALRDSYGYWIREVGVDAFRVDTAFYVPTDAIADFLFSNDSRAPGILQAARQTGRRHFHVFGEGFGIDKPFSDASAVKIERYMTGPGGQPLMPGMINFPLYGTLGDVFARGRPTAELGWRIGNMMTTHARPHLMPSFIDNHDVDRFLAGGSVAALKQSLLAMMTLPGIPTLYYGTEQGFTEPRGAMFARGYGSGGRDRFDTGAPLYRFIAEVSALRRANKVLSRGTPAVLRGNSAGAGTLAWRMDWSEQPKAPALVVFNSAEGPALLDNLDTGLPPGTLLRGLFGIHGTPADLVVDAHGRVTFTLAPRSGQVWQAGAQSAVAGATRPALTVEALSAGVVSDDFDVRGSAPGASRMQLVVDGALAPVQSVEVAADGRWQARIDTSAMVDPAVQHSLVAWDAARGTASASQGFRVERAWHMLADIADPAGDDRGRSGHLLYPTDPSWGANRQMDLRRIKVSAAGGALRLDLTTARLTTVWSPPNGFDHVAFTVFIELPGQDGGSQVMPKQSGLLPEGMRWHRRLRVGGWSNALFSPVGASANDEGTALAMAAQVVTDAASHTVSLILPAAALGGLRSLAGVKLYINTWDHDGNYRALLRDSAPYAMGGGDPATVALVMDETPVIVLP